MVPLCTDRLLMMPSSRFEIWVSYRDATGAIANVPGAGANAIFRTIGFNTGPAGDSWPAVDLAAVKFLPTGAAKPPAFLPVSGAVASLAPPHAIAHDLRDANAAVGVSATPCHPLPAGHRRRIYFNVPADYADLFGLGYEEIDRHNAPVPGTYRPVTEFNPLTPTVCLPLGPDNAPVTERWELVNLAGEDHNFHIHQVKFAVVSMGQQDGAVGFPSRIFNKGLMVDNVPVVHATGGSSTVSQGGCANPDEWKSGICQSTPTVVDIPFGVAGDFVYHCHILEHEDGGMMARIRVRPGVDR